MTLQAERTSVDVHMAATVGDIARRCGPSPVRGAAAVIKRAFDVVVASVLLVVFAPVIAVAAVAVRLDSPGPAFHCAERIGHRGRRITVHKLRTMRTGSPPDPHLDFVRQLLARPIDDATASPTAARTVFKLDHDPRVTRVGAFLRRTSLDELPQLFDVVRGTMSLVGPRPEVVQILDVYEPWMFRRFACLPGMSGLWQVRGRSGLPPREMLRLDVEYADTWSLGLDARIVALTPLRAIWGGGAR